MKICDLCQFFLYLKKQKVIEEKNEFLFHYDSLISAC